MGFSSFAQAATKLWRSTAIVPALAGKWLLLPMLLLGGLCLAPPAKAVTAAEGIAGVSGVTPAQLEAELASINPNHIHPDIAQLYVEWGYRFGIRADLAFSQMLHETNFLRYGGDVQPWQNNFAGIGATGGGNRGNSFSTAQLGVIAHYAHLAWYIFPDHVNQYCNSSYDPRHFGTTHRNTVRILRDLNGQWASPGNGYGEKIAQFASQIWNYSAQGNWLGSFNEIAGTPTGELSTRFYFPWYDWKPEHGMGGNWILIGNMGNSPANVEVYIGGVKMHDPSNPGNDFFTVGAGSQIAPSFYNQMGGPVQVVSTNGQPLLVSQRVLYRNSFNEIIGVPVNQLSTSYEFTWYDSKPQNGMAGNWILIANAGNVPADVEIWLGSRKIGNYSASGGNAIAPGAILTPSFVDTMGGPLRVLSTNNQPLIVSQRVVYRESFSEVMGYPTSQLQSQYSFTWYDSAKANGMNGDWVLVANRGSAPADVDIYVAGIVRARYSAATGNALAPGGIVTPLFPQLTDGPVRVVSTNNQPLMVSQRVLFRDSFEEVQGVAAGRTTSDQWFTWYDSKLVNYMRGNWILVANQGAGTATVNIYIGGVKMHDPGAPGNDFFTIPQGGRITPSFYNLAAGPVNVVSLSGQPLLVSQRVLYKDGLIQ